MPSISVVIVTWNGQHLLPACLDALAVQTVAHELIVVDNGSTDGTRAWLAQHAPHARVIALPHNLGFAGGNNVGMRMAIGDLIVLLNNDTIAAPDFLEQLVAPLQGDDRIGSTAGVLVFAHQPETIASAGILVGRDGLHRDLRALEPVASLPEQPTAIFGASGGAVCYRRAALEDVGLFDERYFNYLEDADLAWRLQLRGWSCMLAPRARVRHIYSATSGQGSPFKQRLLARNRLRVIIRCVPIRLVQTHRFAIVRYDLLAVGYALLHRQPAIISGRWSVLRELPDLIGQRRRLQSRKTVSGKALAHWLAPPATAREMLSQQQALAAVLARAG